MRDARVPLSLWSMSSLPHHCTAQGPYQTNCYRLPSSWARGVDVGWEVGGEPPDWFPRDLRPRQEICVTLGLGYSMGNHRSQAWQYMPVIRAAWEAETGRFQAQDQPRQPNQSLS